MTRSKIQQVSKISMEAQAIDSIREAIVSGTFEQGERLKEIDLSAQMNLSRATLRSALQQVAKEGLITLVPYTGWQVVSLDANDVWELFTLRCGVERLATRILAEHITPIQSKTLHKAFDTLVTQCQKGDSKKIAQADFALHHTIINLTQHSRLIKQYAIIEQQVKICIRSSDDLIFDPIDIISQHEPIIKAIIGGNINLAGELSEQHNLSEGKKLADFIRSRDERITSA